MNKEKTFDLDYSGGANPTNYYYYTVKNNTGDTLFFLCACMLVCVLFFSGARYNPDIS
jgi:hypothetical protein